LSPLEYKLKKNTMGKKAKEHRKKVEKRNRIIAQERQTLQKSFMKMIEDAQSKMPNGQSNVSDSTLGLPLNIPTTEVIPNSTILNGPQI